MLSFELSAFGAQSGSTAMHNVALADNCDKSWNIVRPGGAMITVLSDLILAEQLCMSGEMSINFLFMCHSSQVCAHLYYIRMCPGDEN